MIEQLFEAELQRREIAFTKSADGRYVVQWNGGELLASLDNIARDFARDQDRSRITRFVDTLLSEIALPGWQTVRDRLAWSLLSADTERGDTLSAPLSRKVVRVLVFTDEDESTLTFVTPGMADEWLVTQGRCAGAVPRGGLSAEHRGLPHLGEGIVAIGAFPE